MPAMSAIRAGLKANLDAIDGYQWSPYKLANATPPCGFLWIGPMAYDLAMSNRAMGADSDDLTMMLTVYVALTTDIGAAKKLEPLMDTSGASSVKQAVEADRTLGGVVDDLRVLEHAGEQTYVVDGKGTALGTDFTIRVLT
jgi:hypothetical protein